MQGVLTMSAATTLVTSRPHTAGGRNAGRANTRRTLTQTQTRTRTLTLKVEDRACYPITQIGGDEVGSVDAKQAMHGAHPSLVANPPPSNQQQGGVGERKAGDARCNRFGPTDLARFGPTELARFGPTELARFGPTELARFGPTDLARGCYWVGTIAAVEGQHAGGAKACLLCVAHSLTVYHGEWCCNTTGIHAVESG
jgi:hypothetical protein